LTAKLEQLLATETAGDPMGGLKWTRRSVSKLARELCRMGLPISPTSVATRLKRLGYSLRVNRKCLATTQHPDRDPQFRHIAELRTQYAAEGTPIISIDTKKKELVGLFKNHGAALGKHAQKVLDHDFRSLAKGLAVPYGIYDLQANRGTVFVGSSADTPQFAVDCLAAWWKSEGRQRYPEATRMLILADSGGSNGSRPRAWKYYLQHTLCNPHGLSVTVAHYPSGCSKWNVVEHRLFSAISINWAGRPLDSFETILNYIRTTTTRTGLRVRAERITAEYRKGIKISDDQMAQLDWHKDKKLPNWNYEIRCQNDAATSPNPIPPATYSNSNPQQLPS